MITVHTMTSAMTRIQRLVSRQFWFHTSGVLALADAERVISKLNNLYGLDESEAASLRRLRRHEARARITLWPDVGGVAFLLSATDGAGVVRQREQLLDVREPRGRLQLRQYELVQLPRRGDVARWTWRINLDEFRSMRSDADQYARREHSGTAQQFIETLSWMPGFHGVRRQKKELLASMRREAQRAGRAPLLMPEVIPWVRLGFRRAEPLRTWIIEEQRHRAFRHAGTT